MGAQYAVILTSRSRCISHYCSRHTSRHQLRSWNLNQRSTKLPSRTSSQDGEPEPATTAATRCPQSRGSTAAAALDRAYLRLPSTVRCLRHYTPQANYPICARLVCRWWIPRCRESDHRRHVRHRLHEHNPPLLDHLLCQQQADTQFDHARPACETSDSTEPL
jgi:hypothetical protein